MFCKIVVSPLIVNVNSSMSVGLIAECSGRVQMEEKDCLVLFYISMVHASDFNLWFSNFVASEHCSTMSEMCT